MAQLNFRPSLDDALLAVGEQRWNSIAQDSERKWPSTLRPQAVTTMALSLFAFDIAQKHRDWLFALPDTGLLAQADRTSAMRHAFAALHEISDENGLMRALRTLRARELFIIAWRDLNGLANVEETLLHLSLLADLAVSSAMHWIETDFAPKYGQALTHDGQRQQLMILGMGKLGGQELNFSSDIDLIFAYAEDGETTGPRRLEHQVYFTRIGQKLIHLLSNANADGFVFRTDMRLRPYGDSGPLVMSLDALEDYYQDQGREWERFAMIKARVMYGDALVRERFTQLIKPFVYRRYIDYGVLEAIRRLKNLINQDLRRRQHGDNIKLGAGGIREVEFIVQAFQLIKGGRETQLQSRQLLHALTEIKKLKLLEAQEVDQLKESYLFLRKTENVLQAYADQQTQILPAQDDLRHALAATLGYVEYKDFRIVLDQHRDAVHSIFTSVFGAPTPLSDKPTAPTPFKKLWQQLLPADEAEALLRSQHFANAEHIQNELITFRQSATLRQLSERGRVRMDDLMPQIIAQCAALDTRDEALVRVIHLIRTICRRTAYLELLSENHAALSHLVRLCGESHFISSLLTQFPVLLDDLLDAEALYQPPAPETLHSELQLALLRIERDDQEQLMETLREFHHSHRLRVAAANLSGSLDIVQVSAQLTTLAEAILQEVLELSWIQLTAKHGKPQNAEHEKPFLIIGYGKLGGSELSFSSDLDIVFLYDDSVSGETDGEKPIGIDQFYTRLAQRLMHTLSTRTPAGILYEVDTRLRPSGASGLLVCSFNAYEQYQDDEAWTWEHQALVRARPVAGSPRMAALFREMRRKVLTREREPQKLRDEVINMRQKMRDALDKSNDSQWDVKHGAGGVIDIEFTVQYLVLKHAKALKTGLQFSHSVSLLEQLSERDLLPEDIAADLRDAYRCYRDVVNRLSLQDKPIFLANDQLLDRRQKVSACWQRWVIEAEHRE